MEQVKLNYSEGGFMSTPDTTVSPMSIKEIHTHVEQLVTEPINVVNASGLLITAGVLKDALSNLIESSDKCIKREVALSANTTHPQSETVERLNDAAYNEIASLFLGCSDKTDKHE